MSFSLIANPLYVPDLEYETVAWFDVTSGEATQIAASLKDFDNSYRQGEALLFTNIGQYELQKLQNVQKIGAVLM